MKQTNTNKDQVRRDSRFEKFGWQNAKTQGTSASTTFRCQAKHMVENNKMNLCDSGEFESFRILSYEWQNGICS